MVKRSWLKENEHSLAQQCNNQKTTAVRFLKYNYKYKYKYKYKVGFCHI